jgi:hypothetical protein
MKHLAQVIARKVEGVAKVEGGPPNHGDQSKSNMTRLKKESCHG